MAKGAAKDAIEVIRMCSVCEEEVERFEAKKENLFLTSYSTVFCPKCQRETPELRDIAKRLEAQEAELATLPQSNR